MNFAIVLEQATAKRSYFRWLERQRFRQRDEG